MLSTQSMKRRRQVIPRTKHIKSVSQTTRSVPHSACSKTRTPQLNLSSSARLRSLERQRYNTTHVLLDRVKQAPSVASSSPSSGSCKHIICTYKKRRAAQCCWKVWNVAGGRRLVHTSQRLSRSADKRRRAACTRCSLAVVVAAVAVTIADVHVGPVVACTLGETSAA